MDAIPESIFCIAQYSILIAAIFVAIGGIIGFKKAGSKASLTAGLISGTVLAAAFGLTFFSIAYGLITASIMLVALEFMFVSRLMKTRKFMPSGMLLIVLGIVEAIVILAIIKAYYQDINNFFKPII